MANEHVFVPDLVKIKARDPETVRLLVHQYTGQIYNAALGLGFSASDADDITQNVWVTFFDVLHNFEGRSHIRTFLFGILYNKASELRKKNRKIDFNIDIETHMDQHFDETGHWITGPIHPEKFLSSTQTMKLIQDCLDLLPLPQKMAFHLKEVEDEITEEVCNVLKVTAPHLGVLLFRARNQLRECVEKKT